MKKVCLALFCTTLINYSFCQEALQGRPYETSKIITPGLHTSQWGIKKAAFDTVITKEAIYALPLLFDNDSISKPWVYIQTINDTAIKTVIQVKGKKLGENLFESISKTFNSPQLAAKNLVVNIYKWEFPEGVVNYLEHNKLTQKYSFVSEVI
jgi:hypothetical protein